MACASRFHKHFYVLQLDTLFLTPFLDLGVRVLWHPQEQGVRSGFVDLVLWHHWCSVMKGPRWARAHPTSKHDPRRPLWGLTFAKQIYHRFCFSRFGCVGPSWTMPLGTEFSQSKHSTPLSGNEGRKSCALLRKWQHSCQQPTLWSWLCSCTQVVLERCWVVSSFSAVLSKIFGCRTFALWHAVMLG